MYWKKNISLKQQKVDSGPEGFLIFFIIFILFYLPSYIIFIVLKLKKFLIFYDPAFLILQQK